MKHIILTGMMGCGKSTCAARLGQRLGRRVVDTDEEIERQTGLSVSELFAKRGEAAFRELETDQAARLSRMTGLIIATGGGLPLRAENRRLLRESGVVFYLCRDPGEIYDCCNLSGRPLAQSGREAFLRRAAERDAIYRAFAHVVIEDFSSVEATVDEILRHIPKGESVL